MRTSLILCLGLLLQATPKELIEKLRSDRVEDRDAASAELKKLDAAALPLLEAAAKDPDPEVSRRAGVALRILRLRGSLTLGLRNASPGIEERLASGGDEAYTATFLALVIRPEITAADLEALAVRALRGATVHEQPRVLSCLQGRNLTIAVPDIRSLLHSEDEQVYQVAEVTLRTLAPEAAREAFVEMTRERSPELRCRGIASLERSRMRDQIPRIAAMAGDPEAQVRSDALDALASLGARSEIPRIIDRLRDEDNRVRSSAAQALLNLDARETIPMILTLLRTPPGLEDAQMIDLLSGLGAMEAGPAIAERLGSKNADLRSAAARALADLGAADQAARILPLLGDEDEGCRAAAVWAVGRFGLRDAADQVVRLLADDDSDVRFAAAWAAGRLRLAEAVPALTRMIADNQPDIPGAAAWALGELRVKEALPRLLELAAQSSELGHSAAEAIGAIGEPLSAAQVLSLLGSPNDHISVALLPALRTIPHEQLLPAILRDAVGDDLEKQQRALRHIGILKLSDGAPTLFKVLRDVTQDSTNRILAAESLVQLQRKDIVRELDALVKDDNFPYRENAIHLLGRIEGRNRLPWLKSLLKNQDSNVEVAALLTLEELGSTELLECTLPFLTNPDDQLDVAAASWLCRSGRREGVEVLLREVETLATINGVRNPTGWKKLAAVKIDGILRGSSFDIAERIAREAGLRLSWTWIPGDDDATTRVEQRFPNSDPAPKSGTALLEELVRSTGGTYNFLVEDDVLRILPGARAHQAFRNWFESTKSR